jgi:ABC-2 type transport system permease protein
VSRGGRIRAEIGAAGRTFLRRRTAVFFTFVFPLILVAIFGALVQTGQGSSGLFTEPPAYYVPGYLAVVVLFTPLSRVGSTVARYREGNRFEKLATTPLRRWEWLLAHLAVNAALVGGAAAIIVGAIRLTGADFVIAPVLVPLVALAVVLFGGIGALLGRIADSQDGVISAANAIALPMLFLAETFVPPTLVPDPVRPLIDLLPLTYFARGVRGAVGAGPDPVGPNLAILTGLALVAFLAGAWAIPWTE